MRELACAISQTGMREILIDGYNLIRNSERLSQQESRGGLEAGRDSLIRSLAAYQAATGDRVTVVFDGDEGIGFVPWARGRARVGVIYSRPPDTADDVIVAEIRRSHGKKAMLIVSSDREILRATRRNRLAGVTSEEFETEMIRRAAEGPQRPGSERGVRESPVEGDAAYWERAFGSEKGMFDEDEDEKGSPEQG